MHFSFFLKKKSRDIGTVKAMTSYDTDTNALRANIISHLVEYRNRYQEIMVRVPSDLHRVVSLNKTLSPR